jgi:hypothetical protein
MSAYVVARELVESLGKNPGMQAVQSGDQNVSVVTASFEGTAFAHIEIDAKSTGHDILGRQLTLSQPETMAISVYAIGSGGNISLPTRQLGLFIHALIGTRAAWNLFSVSSLPSSSRDQRVLSYRAGHMS